MKEITVKILKPGYKENSYVLNKNYFAKNDWVYNDYGTYQIVEDPLLYYDGQYSGFQYEFNKPVEGYYLIKQS